MPMETQKLAHQEVKESAKILQEAIKRALRSVTEGATSEELAKLIDRPYASVQPRTSELLRSLEIYHNGTRRAESSGKQIAVWYLVTTREHQQIAINQIVKSTKSLGNEALFNSMLQSIYAYGKCTTLENSWAMRDATLAWARAFADEIGEINYKV